MGVNGNGVFRYSTTFALLFVSMTNGQIPPQNIENKGVNVHVCVGDDIHLSWTPSGSVSDINFYRNGIGSELLISREGKRVTNSDPSRIQVKGPTHIVIKNATTDDSGPYGSLAKTDSGNLSQLFNVTVTKDCPDIKKYNTPDIIYTIGGIEWRLFQHGKTIELNNPGELLLNVSLPPAIPPVMCFINATGGELIAKSEKRSEFNNEYSVGINFTSPGERTVNVTLIYPMLKRSTTKLHIEIYVSPSRRFYYRPKINYTIGSAESNEIGNDDMISIVAGSDLTLSVDVPYANPAVTCDIKRQSWAENVYKCNATFTYEQPGLFKITVTQQHPAIEEKSITCIQVSVTDPDQGRGATGVIIATIAIICFVVGFVSGFLCLRKSKACSNSYELVPLSIREPDEERELSTPQEERNESQVDSYSTSDYNTRF